MSSDKVLPFDISVQIIDIVGETENENLLKRLALVSHSFHQICSKYLFATIELYDGGRGIPSSKEGFVKLVKSRPDVVKHIRKLTYSLTKNNIHNADHLISPILSNLVPTFSSLNCLQITSLHSSRRDWNRLDSSLASAFLHLMHLSTINHICLSFIENFPLTSLSSSVNLHRLDILHLTDLEPNGKNGSFEIVQSETAPEIHEFHTSGSSLPTTRLLHAKRQDGQPAFNFMDLKRLSISYIRYEDEPNLRYLLQNAKLLEKLHLDVRDVSLLGLNDILSASARTLKVLELAVPLYSTPPPGLPLAGLCEELEAMAGHDMLEALSFEIVLEQLETEDSIGSRIQEVERLLVKPGWSALRQVSIKISIACGSREERENLVEALQSLPDKYLSRLSNLESVALNYSVVRQNTGK